MNQQLNHETVFTKNDDFTRTFDQIQFEMDGELIELVRMTIARMDRESDKEEEKIERQLNVMQFNLLGMIDGHVAVFELVELLDADEQIIFLELIKLLELGLIRIKSNEEFIAELTKERARIQLKTLSIFGLIFFFTCAGLFLSDRINAQKQHPLEKFHRFVAPSSGTILGQNEKLIHIHHFIHVYHLLNWDFPESLNELVNQHLVDYDNIIFSNITPFFYKREENGYILGVPEL